MTPAEQAALVYTQEPCANTFEHDLYWHLQNGYVFSTPDYFIMGRPVDVSAPDSMQLDPSVKFNAPNGWLVWLAAGEIACFNDIAPYRLPFIGFQRRNRLRWYKAEKLLSKLCSTQSK